MTETQVTHYLPENEQETQTDLPDWIFDLRDRLPLLLASYQTQQVGWYRLCNDGGLITPGPRAGLGFSCFAAKVMIQCGLWDTIPLHDRTAWIRHIQSFQLPAGSPGFGMFFDPEIERRGVVLYKLSALRARCWSDLFKPNWKNRWAETRQAVATLFAMGAKPLYPIGGFPSTEPAIATFLKSLDWRYPWAAGAQVGHLLFFLRHGELDVHAAEKGVGAVLYYLERIESAKTGGWYIGNVANQEIVNGAMKILAGLYWWSVAPQRLQTLADTAVAETDDTHDCALTNRLFVLHRLTDLLGFIPAGAGDIAMASLDLIPKFLQPDGGLASGPEGSLKRYYYARVSLGKPVGDLHGLTLLSWAITLAAHLLRQQNALGWRLIPP